MIPLVSVVIPVKDQAPRLRLTLAALARQTGVDLGACEVVVVDDGSRDDVGGAIALQSPHPFLSLEMIRSDSRGARGAPRNRGAEVSHGQCLLFLDADACPSEVLVRRHLEAQRLERSVAVGEYFVVARTEALRDPATGERFPQARLDPDAPPLRVSEESWGGGIEAFFLQHAEKGGYPGDSAWRRQLEEMLAAGSVSLAWAAVTPHNLSIMRSDFERLGAFDTTLTTHEGWDFGIRALRAGLPIRFAPGARSFHLYHWRPLRRQMSNIVAAQEEIPRRYAEECPQAAWVWYAALAGNPSVPKELNLHDWRVVASALEHAAGRNLLSRLWGPVARTKRTPNLMDYADGIAINSPFVARDGGERIP